MKSTLPFFAFVSLNVTPYVDNSANDYIEPEYLPGSNKIHGEKTADFEKSGTEGNRYNKQQA